MPALLGRLTRPWPSSAVATLKDDKCAMSCRIGYALSQMVISGEIVLADSIDATTFHDCRSCSAALLLTP